MPKTKKLNEYTAHATLSVSSTLEYEILPKLRSRLRRDPEMKQKIREVIDYLDELVYGR
jgi:hypothetical protein